MVCGLLQTEIHITDGLKELETNTHQLEALKCQLTSGK